jgi:phosphoribosylanthranilate isomerase
MGPGPIQGVDCVKSVDFRMSVRIRETVPVPIFLAGGLKPENVREAIEQIGPFGVDV